MIIRYIVTKTRKSVKISYIEEEQTTQWPEEQTTQWPEEQTTQWPEEQTTQWPEEQTTINKTYI
jgi:hypothetical protein